MNPALSIHLCRDADGTLFNMQVPARAFGGRYRIGGVA